MNLLFLNYQSVKRSAILTLYRSLSLSKDDFEIITGKLELTLAKIFESNLFLVTVLEDFNAKSDQWYKNDETTYEDSKIANSG